MDILTTIGGFLLTVLSIILSLWWIIGPLVLLFIFKELWLEYTQNEYLRSQGSILLEIQIPEGIEHSPKNAEQIFAGLHGIQSSGNLIDRYLKGYVQQWFSFEIVGIGGDIHFFVRTPPKFRNLVESQIYAQYPQAEIAEAEDYVDNVPKDIPNEKYNLYGAELILNKPDGYPIRTYPMFEDPIAKEMIDPLSSLAEVLNKLSEGEQIWIQVLIKPVGEKWKEEGEKIIAKLVGREVKEKKTLNTILSRIIEEVEDYGYYMAEAPFRYPETRKKGDEKKEEGSVKDLLAKLTPGEREVIEAIGRNIAKIGFKSKIRFLYIGQNEVFSKANVSAVVGAFKLFNTQNLNGFKPDPKTKTAIDYFFKRWRENYRKRRIFAQYKERNFKEKRPFIATRKGFVLNIEELATIYHYPTIGVKAPAIPRIESKRGGPPTGLPVS